MQQALLPAHPWAWVYFGSFVLIGVFIVINLFIAVVLNNLETVRAEEGAGADPYSAAALLHRVRTMRGELEELEALLARAVSKEGAAATPVSRSVPDP
jgi:voltage-gated sodium channel